MKIYCIHHLILWIYFQNGRKKSFEDIIPLISIGDNQKSFTFAIETWLQYHFCELRLKKNEKIDIFFILTIRTIHKYRQPNRSLYYWLLPSQLSSVVLILNQNHYFQWYFVFQMISRPFASRFFLSTFVFCFSFTEIRQQWHENITNTEPISLHKEYRIRVRTMFRCESVK